MTTQAQAINSLREVGDWFNNLPNSSECTAITAAYSRLCFLTSNYTSMASTTGAETNVRKTRSRSRSKASSNGVETGAPTPAKRTRGKAASKPSPPADTEAPKLGAKVLGLITPGTAMAREAIYKRLEGPGCKRVHIGRVISVHVKQNRLMLQDGDQIYRPATAA